MNTTTEPASLGLRLLALLYDAFPLLGLWFLAGVIALALTGGDLDVHRLDHKLIVQALVFVFTAGYFVVSWAGAGQTIGMRAWRLKLHRNDARIGAALALLRFLLASLSLLCLGAGFWWALFDAQRRTAHDVLLGTQMQRVPKKKS